MPVAEYDKTRYSMLRYAQHDTNTFKLRVLLLFPAKPPIGARKEQVLNMPVFVSTARHFSGAGVRLYKDSTSAICKNYKRLHMASGK